MTSKLLLEDVSIPGFPTAALSLSLPQSAEAWVLGEVETWRRSAQIKLSEYRHLVRPPFPRSTFHLLSAIAGGQQPDGIQPRLVDGAVIACGPLTSVPAFVEHRGLQWDALRHLQEWYGSTLDALRAGVSGQYAGEDRGIDAALAVMEGHDLLDDDPVTNWLLFPRFPATELRLSSRNSFARYAYESALRWRNQIAAVLSPRLLGTGRVSGIEVMLWNKALAINAGQRSPSLPESQEMRIRFLSERLDDLPPFPLPRQADGPGRNELDMGAVEAWHRAWVWRLREEAFLRAELAPAEQESFRIVLWCLSGTSVRLLHEAPDQTESFFSIPRDDMPDWPTCEST